MGSLPEGGAVLTDDLDYRAFGTLVGRVALEDVAQPQQFLGEVFG